MYIVGLNLTETTEGMPLMDGAAALISESGTLGALAEERIVRKKHAGGIARAMEYLLAANGISADEVDLFAVSICCDVPPTRDHATRVLRSQGLDVPAEKLYLVASHHLAHAASAYYASPFEEAIVFVTDNEGNTLHRVQPNYQANSNERTSYYIARGREITLIDQDATGPGDWGLGNVYGAATQWFGYPTYQAAGQFMGAAAYGDPERFRKVSLFSVSPAGQIVSMVEPSLDKSLAIRRAIFRQTAEDVGWNPPESVVDPSQMQFDIAYLVQSELEWAAVRRIAGLVRKTGIKNLVVAGGVGLNCIMNKRLVEAAGIRDIYVPPAPGDDGQGLGNAMLALFHHCRQIDKGRFGLEKPYLGRAYSEAEISAEVRAHASTIEFESMPEQELLARTANRLADGRIVCWFQGRSEFGPRALGNRSILADPRRAGMKDTLNKRVKHREPFRPFSPSVLAERSLDFFDTAFSPFMNVAASVRPGRQAEIPAVVHNDGTARLQTVRERDNPRFYGLIREFDKITSVPVLLNTSFNNCEPIVETPGDAIGTFLKIDVDYLALGNHLIKKRGGEP